MSKVLFIADKISEDALEFLAASGDLEVDNRPGLSMPEKLEAVGKADAVIVRSATKVDAELLEAASSLSLVVRAGVGVDNIDLDAATRKGVVVQNVPEGNTRSAAEHTIAMMLALSRNIPEAHRSIKAGEWERGRFVGVELQGKTLGIIGFGKIGRHVAHMAAGLGLEILAHDPFLAPHMAEELGIELVDELGDLASRCDFLTVHVPKTEGTNALIGPDVLGRAKDGLRVINCARGGIVDEAALLEAIENGKVAGAALDVFEEEPPSDRALVDHPAVVATPHLGASTREAQVNVALSAAQLVVDYLLHGKLHSPVNAIFLEPDMRERLEPYGELGRRLGRLQAQFLEGNPERIIVKYFGDIFDEPQSRNFVTAGVLAGFLGEGCTQPVNQVNARALAREQGLAVEEVSEGRSRYFANMIRVELADGSGERNLGGSIRGRKGIRLVSLDNYHFDAVLEGQLVIAANEDRPGMIGTIGQVLASHEMNISSMSLGRDRSGGTALSVINLDAPDTQKFAAVAEDLEQKQGILWARCLQAD
ncbi:MAG: phosphoglycerate dehydrogenase [Planctomycetes bacterium]|nr:phosphoglycerate dehydrogenase [Planctomycetota bacterium]